MKRSLGFLVFLLSVSHGLEAALPVGTPVISPWAGRYCGGKIEQVRSGYARVRFDFGYCGNNSDWVKEASLLPLRMVGEYVSRKGLFKKTKIVLGADVLVPWAGHDCAAKVDKISDLGFIHVRFEQGWCGDSQPWYPANLITPFTHVSQITVRGKSLRIGDAVLSKWAGKLCSGKVVQLSASGYARIEFDDGYCGDSAEWVKAASTIQGF